MAVLTLNELLAAIRSLPVDERVRIIEQATRESEEDTPRPPVGAVGSPWSLVGLFSDEPTLVDDVCNLAYESRDSARMGTSE